MTLSNRGKQQGPAAQTHQLHRLSLLLPSSAADIVFTLWVSLQAGWDDDALVTAATASNFLAQMMQPYVVQHNRSIAALEVRSQTCCCCQFLQSCTTYKRQQLKPFSPAAACGGKT